MKSLRFVTAILLIGLCSARLAAEQPSTLSNDLIRQNDSMLQARHLAASCSGCHRDALDKNKRSTASSSDLSASSSIAVLQTFSASDIKQAMLDFKHDKRQGTVMNRIAKGYSDADIHLIAQYLGKP